MGEVIDFNNRRKRNEFKEGLKVDTSNYDRRQSRHTDERIGYIGHRIAPGTPQQRRNHERLRAEAERKYYSKSPEQRAADLREIQAVFEDERRGTQRRTVRKPTLRREPKKFKGSRLAIIGAIVVAIGAGSLAIGANMSNASQENQPITLEQVVNSGKNIAELGIDSDTLERITNLEQRLEGDINVEELVSIGEDLENLQLDIIKSKVANTLGVDIEDVTIRSNWTSDDEPTVESIRINQEDEELVYGDESYSANRDGTISNTIEEYIQTVVNTQVNERNVKDGDFNKEDVIERYRQTLTLTSEFAAGIMVRNDDGTIEIEQTTQKELEEQINREISNDEEER